MRAEARGAQVRDAVERDERKAVGGMDRAAPLKAVGFEKRLHRAVICVRIGAQIVDFCGAEVKAGLGKPARTPVGSKAVDGAVGHVQMPRAVFDHAVSLILAEDEGKRADDLPAVDKDIAVAAGNVPLQRGTVGIAVIPLRGVAVFLHVALGGGEDVHDGVRVAICAFANFHAVLTVPFR